MRLKTIQVIAALAAAMKARTKATAAGVLLLSGLFMTAGLAAVAWLAWSLIRQVHARGRNRTASRSV